MSVSPVSVTSLLSDIAGIGADRVRGGYSRPVFSTAELDLRSWFRSEAAGRGLDVETDRNGIIWAWLDVPGRQRQDAVVTGSHLDSVPGGGAYDGPLGVTSALVALDLIRARRHVPDRPLAIAVFPEEEGSRFGLACLGSGLMAGSVDVDAALRLTDGDGDSLADVMARNNLDPRDLGRDQEALARIGTFVELHVEQGRGLVDLAQPVAIGSSIIAHGRWRLTVSGQGNHAGTTLMADRQDSMTAAARIVLAIRETAQATPLARATVGRLIPIPGGANVIASRVQMWLDVRHPDDDVVRALVSTILLRAGEAAAQEGCAVQLREESYSPTARFDSRLQRRLSTVLPDAPIIATGAGHDAGVLAPFVPTAMLFVRNPTGISHSPEEHAEEADVETGALALADVLADLTSSSKASGSASRAHTTQGRRSTENVPPTDQGHPYTG
jgi:beta-ureidopropionase / N-carbamoyl-L-amino-acid hydrolase